jgi:hypothetical protein
MVIIPSAAVVAVARIAVTVTFAIVGIGVAAAHGDPAIAIAITTAGVAITMAISAEVAAIDVGVVTIAVSVVTDAANAARNGASAHAALAGGSVEGMRCVRRRNANRPRRMSRRVSMNPDLGFRDRGASRPCRSEQSKSRKRGGKSKKPRHDDLLSDGAARRRVLAINTRSGRTFRLRGFFQPVAVSGS